MKHAKTDICLRKIDRAATGGGPPLPKMSQTSQAVAGLFNHTSSFHGICEDENMAFSGDGK
ncbi:hypothetical protein DPMN_163684 [Dreissena polymorpha]|uniref:Uncharacterized protein n=1 Tax=Dreissena polymorpha TaxID=45954 RepID=A0A9D4EW96_DREPO|nr:hypothetical protein DPMN_163684 [Dreissena polymorpha]